jgi:hypothetical protein
LIAADLFTTAASRRSPMVPAKADWSFNRWLMKSRTPALPVAVLPTMVLAANAAVVVVLVAVAPVAVVVVAPVAAMIVIVVAAAAAMATIRWKPAAKNWLKSWFTSTAFRRR